MFSPDADGRWFALQVISRHEKVAGVMLRAKGYEEFVPTCHVRTRGARRMIEGERPLFPGYMFLRYDVAIRHYILATPGVIRVVARGGVAVPVEDHEMEAVRRLTASGLDVQCISYMTPGQLVRIEDGPLSGLQGTVIRSKKGERLVISVALLQRSVSVEIDQWAATAIKYANAPGSHLS